MFNENAGRPAIFTTEAVETIVNSIVNAESTDNTPIESEFRELCHKVVLFQKSKASQAEVAIEPSNSTFGRLKGVVKATERAVQLITPARVIHRLTDPMLTACL